MQPTTPDLNTSNTQFSREPTPVQIHVPIAAPQLFGEDDLIIRGNTRNSAQTHTRELKTPLDLLCRAATTTGLEPNPLCYRFRRSNRDVEYTPAAMRVQIMTHSPSRMLEYYMTIHIIQDATLGRPTRIGSLGACIKESAPLPTPSALSDLGGHRSSVPEHIRPFYNQILIEVEGLKALQGEMQEMTTARPLMPRVHQQNLGLISGETGNPRCDPVNASIAEDQEAKVMRPGLSGNTTVVKRQRDEEGLDLPTQDDGSECSFGDDSHRSKKSKVHCSCTIDRTWWMTLRINSVNKVVELMDAIAEQKKKLDTTLTKLILDDSNGLSDESRGILDEAVFGSVDKFLDESKNVLSDLKDEMKREGGEERVF